MKILIGRIERLIFEIDYEIVGYFVIDLYHYYKKFITGQLCWSAQRVGIEPPVYNC